jgi:amino acid transporter
MVISRELRWFLGTMLWTLIVWSCVTFIIASDFFNFKDWRHEVLFVLLGFFFVNSMPVISYVVLNSKNGIKLSMIVGLFFTSLSLVWILAALFVLLFRQGDGGVGGEEDTLNIIVPQDLRNE